MYLCVMLVYFCLIFSEFLVVLNACVVYGFSFFSDDFIIILDFSFFCFYVMCTICTMSIRYNTIIG